MQNGPQERILWLLYWLQEETDESTPLDSREILSRWDSLGLKTDRRSVYKDVEILRKVGYDIFQSRGESNSYWMTTSGIRKRSDRNPSSAETFSPDDLGHLLDAIQVCRGLSDRTKDSLEQKLHALYSHHRNSKLQRPLVTDLAYRSASNRLEQNLEKIYTAIEKKKKLVYRENIILTKKGFMRQIRREHIVISPYYVRWNRQHYLLVGWSDKESRIATIRVDDMYRVGITENRRRPFPKNAPQDIHDNCFIGDSMPIIQITLLCTKEWLPEILDLFGSKTYITYAGNLKFTAKVHATLCQNFSRWLASTCGDVSIIDMSPVSPA